KTAIYTDFDVPDVKLLSKGLLARLDNYGMAFSGTRSPKNGKHGRPFHNGYLAFRKSAAGVLDHIVDHISGARGSNRSRVFFRMQEIIDDLAKSNPIAGVAIPPDWKKRIANFSVAPPPLWRNDKHLAAKPARKDSPRRKRKFKRSKHQ